MFPETKPEEIKYQIFLSSTYDDLKDERDKLVQTILRSYNFPIGMEMFNANDKESWEVIQGNIDSSDIYILVIGHRYGSLTTGRKPISFTEKEFLYALSRRKIGKLKMLCFIRERDYALPPAKVEQTEFGKKNLARFINSVKLQRAKFTTKEDLCSKVSDAINNTIRDFNNINNPQGGWVRRTTEYNSQSLINSPIIQSIPQIKNFFRITALEFEVTNTDKEVYYFDEFGNCDIETERSQLCYGDVTHSLNGYTNDKPGNFEILELAELVPGSISTNPVILEKSNRGLSFCILYDKLAKKGNTLKYRFKVKVENYISDLFEIKNAYMHFNCLPKVNFAKKIDILVFPKKPIYDKLTVTLIQMYPGQNINRQIDADHSEPKKIKFVIDYGNISNNYNIIIELKLNK